MKKGYLGLLVLFTGCGPLWQGSITPNMMSCAVAMVQPGDPSLLCPSGQVCNFDSGSCEKLLPDWTVTSADPANPKTVYTCAQAQPVPQGQPLSIVITAPSTISLRNAAVEVDGDPLPPNDIASGVTDNVAVVTLLMGLVPGSLNLTVTPAGTQNPVVLAAEIAPRYSAAVPFPTTLAPLPMATVTTSFQHVSQLSIFHNLYNYPLSLAVLQADSPQYVAYYVDNTMVNRKVPAYSSAQQDLLTPVLSGNLTVAPAVVDGVAQPALRTLLAGGPIMTAGTSNPASVVDWFNKGPSNLTPLPGAGLSDSTPITAQLVAAGRFVTRGDTTQIVVLGRQATAKSLFLEYYLNPFTTMQNTVPLAALSPAEMATVMDATPVALATGDLNQDQLIDGVAVIQKSNNGGGVTYEAYSMLGGTTMSPLNRLSIMLPGKSSVAIQDIDGNQAPDIVFGTPSALIIYYNYTPAPTPGTGPATASNLSFTPVTIPVPLGLRSFAITDYNGDGLSDIVYTTNNKIRVLLNTPGGLIDMTTRDVVVYGNGDTAGGPSSPDQLTLADFTGDNRPDVVVSDLPTGNSNVAVYFLENTCTSAIPLG